MRKHCTDCTFQWEDFSPVDYVNWQEGEPNDAGDGEGKGSTDRFYNDLANNKPILDRSVR